MTNQELEQLLQDMESDRVERKASISDPDKICQAICAFANDLPNYQLPGVIFVGIHDNGNCTGLTITDKLLLTLADMRANGNIVPFPTMTVQKHTLNHCEVAVIVVQPADAPPVRFKGCVWIRVGPRRAQAAAQDERVLSEKRRTKDQPFDLRPVDAATLDDFDLEQFRRVYLPSAVSFDVLEQNQRSVEDQLKSLRFITVPGQPTVLGLLTIGNDTRQFLPGAYIQFLRFDGTEMTDPIKDQKEIDGSLPDLLRSLDSVFEAHISVATDFTSQALEQQRPDFPLVALQQLARNAVLHRNYEGTNAPVRIYWFSDRIEIQSPGGPFGQVTRQNFGQPGITDYRNPNLAEALKNLGYVQRFGLGIQIAQRELYKNGNPPLEFMVEDAFTLVIIRK
ncbi:MAG: transcriptional regulator [Acidobacteria bacterium]|nr:transcriptional regulator [Acidobacteriota bacterium]